MSFLQSLKQNKTFLKFVSVIALIVITVIDIQSPSSISFLATYILLVVWVANSTSGRFSYIFAVAAGVCRVYADIRIAPFQTLHLTFPIIWTFLNIAVSNCVVVYLISHKNLALSMLEKMCLTDPLTNLPNRRAYIQRLEAAVAHAQRHKQTVSIAYIDVDRFKAVNDVMGHDQGDKLLILIGQILHSHMRVDDIAARLGGDEFALIFEDGEKAINRIKAELDEVVQRHGFDVSFSIGVVRYTGWPMLHYEELLKYADSIMYEVKKDTKNAIKFSLYTGSSELTLVN